MRAFSLARAVQSNFLTIRNKRRLAESKVCGGDFWVAGDSGGGGCAAKRRATGDSIAEPACRGKPVPRKARARGWRQSPAGRRP